VDKLKAELKQQRRTAATAQTDRGSA